MKLPTAAALLLVAGAAQAHTHLESSVPADKSKVQAPRAIELNFSGPARVTSLTLQHGAADAGKLAAPAAAARHISVPVSGLAAGDYKVNWRVAGKDGHVMSGSFSFTVDPAAAPAAARQGTHQH